MEEGRELLRLVYEDIYTYQNRYLDIWWFYLPHVVKFSLLLTVVISTVRRT